jgi:hypothetical protein
MSLSPSPAANSQPAHSAFSHIHVAGDACPLCDQPIPRERFDEIKQRIETRQAANEASLAARLQDEFARETAEALRQEREAASARLEASVSSARREERKSAELAANQKLATAEEVRRALQAQLDQSQRDSQAAIQRVTEEAAANAVAIREESKKLAEAGAQARIAELRSKHEQSEISSQARIKEADEARTAAERSRTDLLTQLDQARRDHESAVEKVRQESEANAVAIRQEAKNQAQAEVKDQIAALERSRQESEAALQARVKEAEDARVIAQESSTALQDQLNQVRADGAAAIEKAQQDADARVNAARQEATAAAETAMQEKVTGAELAKTAAESKAAAAEKAARVLKETHESNIEARVNEVRLAMEADKLQAVNAANAARSEDNRKMSEQLADLQRKLDQKTAEQLGEGAEVDLYEDLKARFESEGDTIERVGKGKPGADVIHTVKHNGMVCGKIIYDSKNHGQWRYDFAEKLAADKIAEKADHAILSTRKFPEGMKQLDVMDGVILANPARVVALVQVVREHIVKSHTLRMSNEEKALKSAELYAFITSTQYTDLLDRIDTQAQELLDMRVKEQKAHEKTWKDQDILYRSIQKTGAELSNRVDIILGTARKADETVNE